SQQIQATTVILNNGIDEKRAREIVVEKLHEVINGYSQEARVLAESRIHLFANDLIPKLVKASLLDELKDPSLQILLSEAHKTAASSERPADYALLSELLIHRVKKGNDRNVRAGVSRAVEIVDEISDEALLGLTVAHAVSYFIPVTGNVVDGIKILANLFNKIIYNLPPSGNAWLEHLDILDALRINQFGSMKKINQYYSEQFSGYVDAGIDKGTEDFQKALTFVKESNLPGDILCDHELRPGYARLRILNIDRLDLVAIKSLHQVNLNGQIVSLPMQSQLSDEQKQTIKTIYGLYSKESNLRDDNIVEFFKLWDTHESLRILRNWWDSIPGAFALTAVGRVLAHANAQRCDPTLPALD
ncbi:MAG: hypothetical protein GX640_13325, partial [Fibrobacter sp.]|nr:hypothetical protein [Fibrobacter sp.]